MEGETGQEIPAQRAHSRAPQHRRGLVTRCQDSVREEVESQVPSPSLASQVPSLPQGLRIPDFSLCALCCRFSLFLHTLCFQVEPGWQLR